MPWLAAYLKEVPKPMLIMGGGIIGVEMRTIYSTLVESIGMAN